MKGERQQVYEYQVGQRKADITTSRHRLKHCDDRDPGDMIHPNDVPLRYVSLIQTLDNVLPLPRPVESPYRHEEYKIG